MREREGERAKMERVGVLMLVSSACVIERAREGAERRLREMRRKSASFSCLGKKERGPRAVFWRENMMVFYLMMTRKMQGKI